MARGDKQDLLREWIGTVLEWFPDLHKQTYFVPPIHTNTQNLKKLSLINNSSTDPENNKHDPEGNVFQRVACDDVFEQTETRESDFRDDRAQLLTIRYLWRLTRRRKADVMVVLSRYSVGSYMNKTLTGQILSTRKQSKRQTPESTPSFYFPVPRESEDSLLRRGEFDILIIHKNYGFFLLEVKAIGDRETHSDTDDVLAGKISKAVWQLGRLKQTLEFMISDKKDLRIPITKIIAVPNMSREKLEIILKRTGNAKLRKDFIECMNAVSLDDALHKCLCHDEVKECLCHDEVKECLSNFHDDGNVLTDWLARVIEKDDRCCLDDNAYNELIARFCGPLSTISVKRSLVKSANNAGIDVKKRSDATYEMKTQYNMLVLRKDHISILGSSHTHLFLSGPPGSGKTLILLLKAIQWVSKGDVIILLRGPGNNPGHLSSKVLLAEIRNRLTCLRLPTDRVYLETIDASTDSQQFTGAMMQKYQTSGSKIRLLIDEIWVVNLNEKLPPLVDEINKSLLTAASILKDLRQEGAPIKSSNREEYDRRLIEDLFASLESFNFVLSSRGIKLNDVQKLFNDISDHLKHIQSIITNNYVNNCSSSTCSESSPCLPEAVSKILGNTKFYMKTVLSWIASFVLYDVTQVVLQTKEADLWCTGFWPDRCPAGYKHERLTSSIRCPPHVQRLLEQTEQFANRQNQKHNTYVTHSASINPPLPAEGELIRTLNHGSHVQSDGRLGEIRDCATCAEHLADLLLQVLHVGQARGSCLHFRDVLIMDRALLPMTSDCSFLRTLQARGVPSFTMLNDSDDLYCDVDKVMVTNTYNGLGLKKAVVVFVPVVHHSNCGDTKTDSDLVDGIVALGSLQETGARERSAISSTRHPQEPWLQDLGKYNKRGLWFAASCSIADIVIFHVSKDTDLTSKDVE